MKYLLHFAAGLSLLVCLPVLAAGDVDAGQNKAAICAACHGADGNSIIPMWPKIAGQHATYLERQLGLIKTGTRPVPEMAGIVIGLSDQDLADLAAYYSSQSTTTGVTDKALRASGERLYRAGNFDTDIPACMSCHGPAGEGNPLSGYPSIAGQHSVYTEKMLNGFRAGSIWGVDDVNSKVMTEVSSRLTDAEIKAVSSYLQGLHSVTD
jgi:cytochrome c553